MLLQLIEGRKSNPPAAQRGRVLVIFPDRRTVLENVCLITGRAVCSDNLSVCVFVGGRVPTTLSANL